MECEITQKESQKNFEKNKKLNFLKDLKKNIDDYNILHKDIEDECKLKKGTIGEWIKLIGEDTNLSMDKSLTSETIKNVNEYIDRRSRFNLHGNYFYYHINSDNFYKLINYILNKFPTIGENKAILGEILNLDRTNVSGRKKKYTANVIEFRCWSTEQQLQILKNIQRILLPEDFMIDLDFSDNSTKNNQKNSILFTYLVNGVATVKNEKIVACINNNLYRMVEPIIDNVHSKVKTALLELTVNFLDIFDFDFIKDYINSSECIVTLDDFFSFDFFNSPKLIKSLNYVFSIFEKLTQIKDNITIDVIICLVEDFYNKCFTNLWCVGLKPYIEQTLEIKVGHYDDGLNKFIQTQLAISKKTKNSVFYKPDNVQGCYENTFDKLKHIILKLKEDDIEKMTKIFKYFNKDRVFMRNYIQEIYDELLKQCDFVQKTERSKLYNIDLVYDKGLSFFEKLPTIIQKRVIKYPFAFSLRGYLSNFMYMLKYISLSEKDKDDIFKALEKKQSNCQFSKDIPIIDDCEKLLQEEEFTKQNLRIIRKFLNKEFIKEEEINSNQRKNYIEFRKLTEVSNHYFVPIDEIILNKLLFTDKEWKVYLLIEEHYWSETYNNYDSGRTEFLDGLFSMSDDDFFNEDIRLLIEEYLRL